MKKRENKMATNDIDKENENFNLKKSSESGVKKCEPMAQKVDKALWNRFREWVHCVCIVTFDLELGQAMETIFPKHVTLTEQEKMNVCYLAFPDSNSGCMGDSQFHIRLRVSPASETSALKEEHCNFNNSCLPTQRADPGHYWGFVYFRQIKDSSLKRGYFQKSLVLLTRLPFINLFYEICSLIAPAYFDSGEPCLESICDNICRWPSLITDETIVLPILGNTLQTFIPKQNSKSSNASQSPIKESNVQSSLKVRVLSSVHDIDIFKSLQCILPHIHMLWELVLTAEPLVVIGTSPTDCAHMVQSLMSLIHPLSYCAESRPYFTIHDTEFKEFTQNKNGHPSIILGVTNPFFAKTLQHWPHTIRLQSTTLSTYSVAQTKLSKIKLITNKLLDSAPGVYSQYKTYLQKDKAFIKKILLGIKTKRPPSVQSALLRRHMLELTQSFMIPLERYMASLMPLQKDISPFKAAPNPNQFKQDDFLATLEESGPQLTSTCKGDWEGLYKRFFRSPNFKGWYENRYVELQQTLQALQMQALSEVNLNVWSQNKHEVEIVDMILKLKQQLSICNQQPECTNFKKGTRDQLLKQLEGMKKTLPDDLKLILDNT